MSEEPSEEADVHTRLLKCALEVEDARAFWAHADATPETAFEEYWFGARSLARRVEIEAADPGLGSFAHALNIRPRSRLGKWLGEAPESLD